MRPTVEEVVLAIQQGSCAEYEWTISRTFRFQKRRKGIVLRQRGAGTLNNCRGRTGKRSATITISECGSHGGCLQDQLHVGNVERISKKTVIGTNNVNGNYIDLEDER